MPQMNSVWHRKNPQMASSASMVVLAMCCFLPMLAVPACGFRAALPQTSHREGQRSGMPGTCMALKKSDPPPPTLSAPVFSLATLNDDGTTNMNIITYVVPVGIRPARKWVLSLWEPTLTHANFKKRRRGVLQLLRRQHVDLIPILGKQRGSDVNKQEQCATAGFDWAALLPSTDSEGAGGREGGREPPLLLPNCAAYYPVSFPAGQELMDAGEHQVALVDLDGVYVDEAETMAIEAEREGEDEKDIVMYTAWLRAEGVIE